MTAESHFREVAPKYMRLLMADFSFSDLDAAAVFGNFGHESLGLTALQEFEPTVKGSRGGWGWAQWTGPRRKAFEAYCKRNGKDPAADATNYAYVFVELNSSHSSAVGAVKRATTLESKMKAFEKHYEGAGVKHYPERLKWAQIALDALTRSRNAPSGSVEPAETTVGTVAVAGSVTPFSTAAAETKETTPVSNRPILDAIKAGTAVVLNREHVDVERADVKSVTEEVMREVAPRVQNATNAEPWYQSRIIIGLITAIVGMIVRKAGGELSSGTVEFAIQTISEIVAALGALYALYGRTFAASKKPLGVK